MRKHECTEELFLGDVSRHAMTVLRDDGVHRHIRFKRPDSGTYWFDLITWPGTLCIDGDMGTYVFRRLEDMFQFFRTDRRDEGKLGINPGYWGEKLQAEARHGFKEFSPELFRAAVKSDFDQWVEYHAADDETKASALWEEIEERVLHSVDDGERDAITAAMEFTPDDDKCKFNMRDFFEHRLQDYTFHFIWCCYAIAWGVRTYDQAKARTATEAA